MSVSSPKGSSARAAVILQSSSQRLFKASDILKRESFNIFQAHSSTRHRLSKRYDRTLIRVIVTVAYTGWIAFSALFILVPRKPSASWTPGSPVISLLSVSTLLAFWALFALQKSAWTLYIYIVFPIFFWHRIIEQTGELISFWRRLEHTTPLAGSKLAVGGVLVVAALQSMVVRVSTGLAL